MGYYTNFDFKIKTPMTEGRVKQIADRLNTIMDCEDCFEPVELESKFEDNMFTILWGLEPYDEMMWYDWREDMSQLAEEFPDVEFRLEGNGKDKDDWWVALFKGERKQIKYCSPPVDEWDD